MKFRKLLVVGWYAASLGALCLPVSASADVGIYFNTAPPQVRYEAVPAARSGYLWAPGYWNAHGHRHVWQAGHWERERHGYYWSPSTWTQHNDKWQLQRGRWNKGDRDHDGVPNAIDRAPDNPTRH